MRLIALFLTIGLLALGVDSRAALTATNAFSLQSVAGPATNNGNAFSLSSVTIPSVTYFVQNTGLVNTNALRVDVQFSFDQANWTTLTNFVPSITNSDVAAFVPQLNPMTIYVRCRVAATNTVTAGITAVRIFQ